MDLLPKNSKDVLNVVKFLIPFFFFYQYKLKHKDLLHSTVPSKAGIGRRSSGPHFG